MYKCYVCKKQFVGGIRHNPHTIWKEYTSGKQTYEQLAKKYNCSKRTIQRKIDLYKVSIPKKEPFDLYNLNLQNVNLSCIKIIRFLNSSKRRKPRSKKKASFLQPWAIISVGYRIKCRRFTKN